MKRTCFTFTLLLLFVFTQAQISINNFDHKDKHAEDTRFVVSAGLGYPNLFNTINFNRLLEHFDDNRRHNNIYNGTSTFSTNLKSVFLLKGEYWKRQNAAFGINLSYANVEWNAKTNYTVSSFYYGLDTTQHVITEKIHISSFSIGTRYNRSWLLEDNIQFYSGFGAGFSINKIKDEVNRDGNIEPSLPSIAQILSPLSFNLSLTAGVRYFFYEDMGIYCELGYEKWSIIQGGITYKL